MNGVPRKWAVWFFVAAVSIALIIQCAGCETLASRDMAAGCQVADIASTHYALHHNPDATEQNAIPVPVLDLIKLALAAYIKWGDNHWEDAPQGVRIFVTAVGCGAAVNNIHVAGKH
jgi:hypothetical protein